VHIRHAQVAGGEWVTCGQDCRFGFLGNSLAVLVGCREMALAAMAGHFQIVGILLEGGGFEAVEEHLGHVLARGRIGSSDTSHKRSSRRRGVPNSEE